MFYVCNAFSHAKCPWPLLNLLRAYESFETMWAGFTIAMGCGASAADASAVAPENAAPKEVEVDESAVKPDEVDEIQAVSPGGSTVRFSVLPLNVDQLHARFQSSLGVC